MGGQHIEPDAIRRALFEFLFIRGADSSRAALVVRGLLWALRGEDPGTAWDVPTVLGLAGIPHRSTGGRVMVDPDWQRAHGFVVTEADMKEWEEVTR